MKVKVEACDHQSCNLLFKGHIDQFHNTMMLSHQRATNDSPTHVTAEHPVLPSMKVEVESCDRNQPRRK